jgi:hypothetical protein
MITRIHNCYVQLLMLLLLLLLLLLHYTPRIA